MIQVGIMNLYLTDTLRTELQNVSMKNVNYTTTRREIHWRNKLLFLMGNISCGLLFKANRK